MWETLSAHTHFLPHATCVCARVYVRGDIIITITTQRSTPKIGCHHYHTASLHIHPHKEVHQRLVVITTILHHSTSTHTKKYTKDWLSSLPYCITPHPSTLHCYGWSCQWPGTKSPTSAEIHFSKIENALSIPKILCMVHIWSGNETTILVLTSYPGLVGGEKVHFPFYEAALVHKYY